MTPDPYVPALYAWWRTPDGLVACEDADIACDLTRGATGVGRTLALARADLLAQLRRRLVGGRAPLTPSEDAA